MILAPTESRTRVLCVLLNSSYDEVNMLCPGCATQIPDRTPLCTICGAFYHRYASASDRTSYALMGRKAYLFTSKHEGWENTRDFALTPDDTLYWLRIDGTFQRRLRNQTWEDLEDYVVQKFWARSGSDQYALHNDESRTLYRNGRNGQEHWHNTRDFDVCVDGQDASAYWLYWIGGSGSLVEKRSSLDSQWETQTVPGVCKALATTANGYIFALSTAGTLWRQQPRDRSWVKQADSVAQLVRRGADAFWLTYDGRLFRNTFADRGSDIRCSIESFPDPQAAFVTITDLASVDELMNDTSHVIDAFLQAARDSKITLFFPSGVYRFPSQVNVGRSHVRLIGDSSGETLFQSAYELGEPGPNPKTRSMFDVTGREIAFQFITFDQSAQPQAPPGVAWDIITLNNVNDCLIANCHFTGGPHHHGDSHITVGGSTCVRITRCRFENACDQGVYVTNLGCLGVVIEGCEFVGCGKLVDGRRSSARQPQGHGYSVGIARGAELTIIRNNSFRDALYGVAHQEGDDTFGPQRAYGTKSLISGNRFDRDVVHWIDDPRGESTVR